MSHTAEDFQRWTNWANIFALLVGVVGTAMLAFDKPKGAKVLPEALNSQPIGRVVEDLSVRLERDWAHEAVLREVTRPRPVRVRWSPTGQRSASRELVFGADEPAGEDEPSPGDRDVLHEMVEAFRRLKHRQLMVLGGPGAGKSVFGMLLTLGLLRSASRVELPVLLPIKVWDPRVEAFVARRLVEDYPDVLAPHGDPVMIAGRLVSDRRIVPVLDGLDELPAADHTMAMDALDTFAAMGRPLVVTCRFHQYVRAVARGRVLSQAAVVELELVEVEDAIRYLSELAPDSHTTPFTPHSPNVSPHSKPKGILRHLSPSPSDPAYRHDKSENLRFGAEAGVVARTLGNVPGLPPPRQELSAEHRTPERPDVWAAQIAPCRCAGPLNSHSHRHDRGLSAA